MLNTPVISMNKKERKKERPVMLYIYFGFYCNWRWWCNCWPLRLEQWWVVLHLSYKDGDDIMKRLEGVWWRLVRRRRGQGLDHFPMESDGVDSYALRILAFDLKCRTW